MKLSGIDRFASLIIISLVMHMAIALFIFLLPQEKKKEIAPIIARLVTPDEADKKETGKSSVQSRPFIPRPYAPTQARSNAKSSPAKPSAKIPQIPAYPGREQHVSPNDNIRQQEEKPAAPLSADKGISPSDAGRNIEPSSGRQNKESGKSTSLMGNLIRGRETEIIGKVAEKEGLQTDNAVKFGTKDLRYGPYMSRLKDKIERIWKYPQAAAARGLYGDLDIVFTIKKNGMLGDVELARTSGHRLLDEAAMQALKDAQPFWPLPDEWGMDSITIPGHFTYSIYGTIIR